MKSACLGLFLLAFMTCMHAQDSPDDQAHIQPRKPVQSAAQPKPGAPARQPAQQTTGESSSLDSQIDLSAHPRNDTAQPAEDSEDFPYDPHKAAKDVEVGQFYLKRKNYTAALDRLQEALRYKPNDAEATFYLAETQEALDLTDEAYKTYNRYLEILPEGPFSKQSTEAMKRLEPRLQAPLPESSKQSREVLHEGEVLMGKSELEAARGKFEQALRLDPNEAIIYFRLGQVNQALQRLDPARLYYKKYLELDPKGPGASDAKKAIADINFILGKA